MKIRDILTQDKVTISFEVFPPKAGMPFDSIQECTSRIARLKPDFCSVTYGANGGASVNTAAVASFVQNDLGITALAHLTGVLCTKDSIKSKCQELRSLGIENILALRGDLPAGQETASGDFRYASDLIRAIREEGDFCIGGACYPEGHVDSEDKHSDLETLRLKQEAGADYLITQMFFDNDIFYNFMYRLRDKGISLPIIPGIMPLTNAAQIKRIKAISGANMPAHLLAAADAFHNRPDAMRQAGIVHAASQIIDLVSNGVRAFHLYTMNKPEIVEGIMQNLDAILGRNEPL